MAARVRIELTTRGVGIRIAIILGTFPASSKNPQDLTAGYNARPVFRLDRNWPFGHLAGTVGIEPTTIVLETIMMPLHHVPMFLGEIGQGGRT